MYEVQRREHGDMVAAKVIPVEAVHSCETHHFGKLVALQHPNIVTFLDVFVDEALQNYYIVMELCVGSSLEDTLNEWSSSASAAVDHLGERHQIITDIVRQLFDALTELAARNIAHRDVKPANIMVLRDHGNGTPVLGVSVATAAGSSVSEDYRRRRTTVVKLVDFNVMKPMPYGSAEASDTGGHTTRYVAPERRRGSRRSGPLGDVYSVGVVLLQLADIVLQSGYDHILTTNSRFLSQLRYHVVQRLLDRDGDVPCIDIALIMVASACLHERPSGRPNAESAAKYFSALLKRGDALSSLVQQQFDPDGCLDVHHSLPGFIGPHGIIPNVYDFLHSRSCDKAGVAFLRGPRRSGKTKALTALANGLTAAATWTEPRFAVCIELTELHEDWGVSSPCWPSLLSSGAAAASASGEKERLTSFMSMMITDAAFPRALFTITWRWTVHATIYKLPQLTATLQALIAFLQRDGHFVIVEWHDAAGEWNSIMQPSLTCANRAVELRLTKTGDADDDDERMVDNAAALWSQCIGGDTPHCKTRVDVIHTFGILAIESIHPSSTDPCRDHYLVDMPTIVPRSPREVFSLISSCAPAAAQRYTDENCWYVLQETGIVPLFLAFSNATPATLYWKSVRVRDHLASLSILTLIRPFFGVGQGSSSTSTPNPGRATTVHDLTVEFSAIALRALFPSMPHMVHDDVLRVVVDVRRHVAASGDATVAMEVNPDDWVDEVIRGVTFRFPEERHLQHRLVVLLFLCAPTRFHNLEVDAQHPARTPGLATQLIDAVRRFVAAFDDHSVPSLSAASLSLRQRETWLAQLRKIVQLTWQALDQFARSPLRRQAEAAANRQLFTMSLDKGTNSRTHSPSQPQVQAAQDAQPVAKPQNLPVARPQSGGSDDEEDAT